MCITFLGTGTYNTEINKLFKLNNLPSIILPDNPPTLKILNMSEDKVDEEKEMETEQEDEAEKVIEGTETENVNEEKEREALLENE